MSFSMETKKENKLSFLEVEIAGTQGKFTTAVYRKPIFLVARIVTLKVFLPSVYKSGMIYTLVYRCSCFCSNWTQFHTVLNSTKGIFQKNSYPENFIDKCPSCQRKHTNNEKKEFALSPFILSNIFAN